MADTDKPVRSDPNKLIGKTVSHYAIQEVLGGGGMGVVYLAEDTRLQRPVALKFLPPALSQDARSKERFLAEAQAASALDHPNICNVHEFGETDNGRLFIAMAYYAGESLRQKIDDGPLGAEESLDYAIQIARGLAAAHGAGIVHRDIKPANVVVTEDGVAKILDFGIARAGEAHLTQTGASVGTTGYMSPEQTRGEEVDGRADIWAVGVLLYEALTGVRPFRGDYDQAVIYSILNEDPEPLALVNPDVSSDIESVVNRCLQKDPAMRYQDAEELLVDLEAVHKGAAPRAFLRLSSPNHLRTSTKLLVAAVVLLFGIASMYILMQDRGEASDPESALEAAPGIAVLPFTVQGQDLEVLREGMVSLISTALDGVAGLRTISPRTVFARWRERVSGEGKPDLATLLEIARDTGARYALVGSAVGIGSNTRLVANIYDVETGDRLGQARSEGSSDDVLQLVDRLGVEVLSVILQKGVEELPKIDLASLTTSSPEALMAYLEGEVHFRHFDIPAALEAYSRAVDADSTFALAHVRLSLAYGWRPENATLRDRHATRAAQFSDRLPAREALLVRAWRAQLIELLDELDALRQAVRTYPDDAEIWYQLGETLYHVQGAMAPAEDVEAAFERAVHIDPGNARYLVHYVFFAWTIYADSQEAAHRLAMYERASSAQNIVARAGRLALDLAFGDSTAQADAMTRLETEDYDVVFWTSRFLKHPRYRQRSAVTRMLLRSADDDRVNGAWWRHALDLTYYGRFNELLELMEDPRIEAGRRAHMLHLLREVGFPVPVESLEEAMESIAIDSNASFGGVQFAGVYAADEERWSDHEQAIAEMEVRADRARADADSLRAWNWTRDAKSLRGYGLWRRGDPEAALAILGDPNQLDGDFTDWWWPGQLYQELGRFRDAERVYRTHLNLIHPLVHRELGGVYEALQEYDKAREAYEYFVEYWNEADPELQPTVEEARQAIIRLQQM